MIVEYNCRGNCPRGSLRGRLELRLGVVPDPEFVDQEGGFGAIKLQGTCSAPILRVLSKMCGDSRNFSSKMCLFAIDFLSKM